MEVPPKYFKVSQHCANVYVVSWIDVTENRHVGRRSHLRPKDTLAEVTFPSHTAAEYIEHAQLLAMDYSNMLTAVAVRKYTGAFSSCEYFVLRAMLLSNKLSSSAYGG